MMRSCLPSAAVWRRSRAPRPARRPRADRGPGRDGAGADGAGAAATTPPAQAAQGERAAAREFSFAAYRLRVAVLGLTAAEDKITIAARRMRALGVIAGAARRFTGDGMFRGIGLSLF